MGIFIAQALAALFQIWASHASKPPGWTPSQQDIQDMLATIDAATPEKVKADARARLGLPDPVQPGDLG